MSDPTVDEVVRLGGDPAGFAARQLTAELVTDAGLVITATRTHRAAVATLVPRAARHTFTLLELARLLPLVDPSALPSGGSRIAGLAAAAAAKRGLPGRVAPGADDVPDPYLQQAAVYRLASDVMVPAVTALAAILG